MNWKSEIKPLALIGAVFALFYFFPFEQLKLPFYIIEALMLTQWYAREHVILCLLPAFFIAGAIGVFVSREAVMKYLGAGAKKTLAYGVASVSGGILAVCSCTVLPLFAGIYNMGAGIGPATTFLYAGPAINVLAIILTARILGWELGIARVVGAVGFSILIGLLMSLIYRRQETRRAAVQATLPPTEPARALWQNALFFAVLVAILVFANWGKPIDTSGLWFILYQSKWWLTGIAAAVLGVILRLWFGLSFWMLLLVAVGVFIFSFIPGIAPVVVFFFGLAWLARLLAEKGGEAGEWLSESWGFARQIMPLLLIGVLISGALLGRPGHEGLIPSRWIATAVGGNSIGANLFAAVAGAFMYFATLTEVPILQGLIGSGMGKGPALALLLAGPALSLPSMLVIRSIIGTQKMVVYVTLVILLSTLAGMIFGRL
jgi:uncharacterized membrane protein YraQ (UPF0718 family)